MSSTQKPNLRLVWPLPDQEEPVDDSSSTLELALESDGWRSVSVEDLRALPPDWYGVVKAWQMLDGTWRTYVKTLPKSRPRLL